MVFKQRKTFPRENSRNLGVVLGLFFLSLFFYVTAKTLPLKKVRVQRETMITAAEIMGEAMAVLKTCREENGLGIDQKTDINRTGLIGVEFSPITTSIGNLEAKRTTANPNMAALVVHLLQKAGIREGDAVAVGASGSFPALIIAVMSAAKAMDIDPLLMCSLGASQWGANRLDFHFLKMLECLSAADIFDYRPVGVSIGGERDVGDGMPDDVRALLVGDIEDGGFLFIKEPELSANVQKKMHIFEEKAGSKGIKCFVNIGGNWSNIGVDSEILNLKPGLVKIREIPADSRRGLVFQMADRQIPVIHLLFIKGLVERYGLPWDPVPLPEAGSGQIYQKIVEDHPQFIVLGGLYLLVVVFLLFLFKKIKKIT